MPGVELRLFDVNAEGVGEIAARGPNIMRGYYGQPAATAAAFRDGWLLTGDMARTDEDGFIHLVDRKKDVIITGGENIYPVQVEDFLHRHPDVKDVAVIGLPDERLGEVAAAIVQLKRGQHHTEAEILEFCSDLPRYKRPRRVIFDQVPRNATGKIDKPELRRRYQVEGLVQTESEQ